MALQTSDANQTGLTVGATLTTANSGGGTNTALTAVNGTILIGNAAPSTGTLDYESASVTATKAGIQLNITANANPAALGYFQLSGLPTGTVSWLTVGGGGQNFVAINSSGHLIVGTTGNAALYTGAYTLLTGTRYRVELFLTIAASGATVTMGLYIGESSTAVDSFTTAVANTGTTNVQATTLGKNTTAGNLAAFIMGTLAVLPSASGLIGPLYAQSATGSITLGGSSTGTGPGTTASGSISLSGSTTATVSTTAGGTITLGGSSSAAAASVTSARVGALTSGGFSANVDSLNVVSGARLAVSTVIGMTSPVFNSGSRTAVDGQGCVTLAITGLTADTDYYWQFELDGTLTGPVGRAHTFPSAAQAGHYSFIAAGCGFSNNGASYTNNVVFANAQARLNPSTSKRALFNVHLGDMHYDDITTNHAGSQSLARNMTSFRGVMAQSNQAALYNQIPLVYTVSDHDYGSDNCDGSDGNGQYFLAAYRELFPHYPLVPDTNGDTGDDGGLGIYHTFTVGQICYIVTDGRSYMDPITKTDNSSKTKLGATQKAWLKATALAAAQAGKLVVWLHEDAFTNPGTFVGDDTWGAYNTERTEIGTYLTTNGIIIYYVHSDYHVLEADTGTNNSWGGFPAVCVGPWQQTTFRGSGTMSQGFHPNPVNGAVSSNQYGWFDVTDTTAGTVTIAFTGFDASTGSDVSAITMSTTFTLPATASGSITLAGSATGKATGTPGGSITLGGSSVQSSTAGGSITLSGSATGYNSAYDTAVLADSPLAWWKLNEASGTSIADSSGNSHTGTATAVTLGQTGPILTNTLETGGLFNGTSSQVASSYNPSLTALTVEAWVNCNGNSQAFSRIVANDSPNPSQNGFEVMLTGTTTLQVVPEMGNGTTHSSATTNGTFSNTGWHHIVTTWDGTTIRVYIDNVLDTATGSFTGPITAGANGIGIGYDPATSNPFPGKLAQVAIYGTALSQTRVTAHYNAALGSGSSPASGTGSITLSGSSTATTSGTASGSITLGGSTSASVAAVPSGSITLGGSSTGQGPGNFPVGAITLSGSSTASVAAAGSGSITLTGTTTATVSAQSSGSIVLSGTVTVTTTVTVAGTITLTGSTAAGSGRSAAGSITLAGSSTGTGSNVIVVYPITVTGSTSTAVTVSGSTSQLVTVT